MQAEFVYVAADERFFLHGNLYDSNSRRNVTETSRQEDRLEVVDPIDPETLIVLAPADPKAGTASWTGIARAPETEHQGDRFRDSTQVGVDLKDTTAYVAITHLDRGQDDMRWTLVPIEPGRFTASSKEVAIEGAFRGTSHQAAAGTFRSPRLEGGFIAMRDSTI